jgi:hypothetical protein
VELSSDGAVRISGLMGERKSFPLRIDPALYSALERWAEQEFRSVNGQIEFLLKEAVRRRDRRAVRDRGSGEPPAGSAAS